MPMLAEVVDAVVGIDTHRDVHVAELAGPTGTPLAITQIPNTSAGYLELLGWVAQHSPGPRVVVTIEGTRSFGIGLARTLSAAGLPVLECEQPTRKARRGRGKSDPIDAHLAVLTALQLDADRLPTPRADGVREALRILLTARQELTTTATAQTNRLRALLLSGSDRDRDLSRASLTDATLAALARRRLPTDATVEHAVRHDEIRRLSVALRQGAQALKVNRSQLGEPPRFRIPDPIRSGPERRTIDAGTA
jgi:transposase